MKYITFDQAIPHLQRYSQDAAGFDLHAAPYPTPEGRRFPTEDGYLVEPGRHVVVATGVGVEIPPGHAGLILLRSRLGIGAGCGVHVGLIDPDYRGEIFVALFGHALTQPLLIRPYERFAQLLLVTIITPTPERVTELSPSARGVGMAGSTGSGGIASGARVP